MNSQKDDCCHSERSRRILYLLGLLYLSTTLKKTISGLNDFFYEIVKMKN